MISKWWLFAVTLAVVFTTGEASAQEPTSDPAPEPATVATERESVPSPVEESGGNAEISPAEAREEPSAPDDMPLPDEQFLSIEEIVVTSSAGSRNLQDLGVSVASFDAEYLDALGAQNIADIAQFTPNLEIRTVFAASNPTLFIRGVGLRDFNANSASSVAVYNDDIYMNSPAGQLSQLFDVQQVEVLRGPQGTLFGRNASAGAIRVVSRKPTGDVNGQAKITYGNYNNIEAEGAFEVPLSEVLTVRIAGVFRQRDGTTLNRCGDARWKDRRPPPTPPPGLNAAADFDYRVHGEYNATSLGTSPQNSTALTPHADPYGTSRGCFNSDTMLPLEPLATGINPAGLSGPGWSPGWVGFPNIPDNPAPRPPPVDRLVNNVDNWAVRGLMRWQPNERTDWVLNIHGGQNNGGSRQFQGKGARQSSDGEFISFTHRDALGYSDPDNAVISFDDSGFATIRYVDPLEGDPHAGSYNRNDPERLDLYGTSLTGSIRADHSLLFKTISGFEGNKRRVRTNLDASPLVALEPTLENDAWQLSQEFKLIYDSDGPLALEIGASYLYEDLNVSNIFDLDKVTNTTIQRYHLGTNYAAVYGWASWSPNELFSVDGGARLNYENKTMDLETTRLDPFSGNLVPPGVVTPPPGTVSDTGLSGDLSFNYKPRENNLVYIKYSRGYKGPHLNGAILNPRFTDDEGDLLTEPVKPEEVDAFEFGAKTTWLDNSFMFNFSAFYYIYRDIQIFTLRNTQNAVPISQLINANEARIYGAELEVRAFPLRGLVPEFLENMEFLGSFGYLRGRYLEFANSLTELDAEGLQSTSARDYSGNQLVNSPEFAFSGYLSWPLESDYGTLTPRFDWSFKDQVFFGPEDNPEIGQAPLWLMNFRLAFRTADSRLEIAGWVRNLADKKYRLDAINLARFRQSVIYAIGDPRTFGVTLQVTF